LRGATYWVFSALHLNIKIKYRYIYVHMSWGGDHVECSPAAILRGGGRPHPPLRRPLLGRGRSRKGRREQSTSATTAVAANAAAATGRPALDATLEASEHGPESDALRTEVAGPRQALGRTDTARA